MINVYFVGTAGSGKSTLVYAFQQWMTLQGLDTITVNLDPGAEQIPYEPDVDIRDWVKVEEVMRDYGLGPNGAQIVCADLMALNSKELVETVEKFRTNYVLIDTPGQIELFAFRQSSQVIIDALGRDQSFLAFLSDPALARTASGYVSMLSSAPPCTSVSTSPSSTCSPSPTPWPRRTCSACLIGRRSLMHYMMV